MPGRQLESLKLWLQGWGIQQWELLAQIHAHEMSVLTIGNSSFDGLDSLINIDSLKITHCDWIKPEPISPPDVISLPHSLRTLTLNIKLKRIPVFTGASNLNNLGLVDYKIDVDGKVFTSLKNLNTLSIRANSIFNINKLPENIFVLTIQYCNLSKIEGLDHLTNLAKLDLAWNQITKLEGLDHLIELMEINLRGNKITAINGLANNKKLRRLNLIENTTLTDFDGLAELPSGCSVAFNNCKISRGIRKKLKDKYETKLKLDFRDL